MPYCSNCGKELSLDSFFCPGCGTPSESKKSSREPSSQSGTGSGTIDPGAGSYGLDYDNVPHGTMIDGKYRIEEKLGKGGFGTVYKAWYDNMDEWRALKIISREHYDDKEIIRDLRIEAKKLNSVNHPNVVRFYDVHLTGEIKYFDMEYVDGGDLVDLKLSYPDKRVPEEMVRGLALQIARGMIAIHEKNIIHKDIKPHNILLTKEGVVKITDFGIAEQFSSSRSRLKLASRAGTPAYMSPEHLIGEDVGRETDIWSFGVMICELLTGKQLYKGESQTDILTQIERRPFQEVPGLPLLWNSLLAGCLKYNFRERICSFYDIIKHLEGKTVLSAKETSELIDMIFVKGGSFDMGSEDEDADNDEKPVHMVTLDSYYIGKCPITQKQYQQIMGNNPSRFKGDNLPVEEVCWYNAIEFCNKLSMSVGLTPVYSINGSTSPRDWSKGSIAADWNANGYRLPTESEWEYAARGGNKSRGFTFSGSNNIDDVAWYHSNSDSKTQPVGTKRANELGIHDMSGNVWECCWDWHDEYTRTAKTNPRGPSSGSSAVLRGGSWYDYGNFCRVAYRAGVYRSSTNFNYGFRVARTR